MSFSDVIETIGTVIDGVGVGVLVVGGLVTVAVTATRIGDGRADAYRTFRQMFGRTVLLSLEILIAADIVRTVAVTPTLDSVLVLGLIVLIRTFLSFSLELEITGRWPWQKPGPP
ncbi:MAG TPA: DUF1622 domain-containing protein [Jatrophihabitans sp.]|nr:DUF1622 domain-containing protein [Jatrophihabitans sp.]